MTNYGKKIIPSSSLEIIHPLNREDSCSNGRIFLSKKIDKNSNITDKYIHKLLDEDDDPFIGTCEAIMSDCYHIIAPGITPMVFVVSNGVKPIAVISKLIDNYRSFGDCTSKDLEQLLNNKQKELAALLVSGYINADDDLHDDNWGFVIEKDKNGIIDYANSKIIKIDNDLAAFAHTYAYSGRAEREKKADVISDFPNRSYKASNAFDISILDIKSFPSLRIHKSTHWPFRKKSSFADFLRDDKKFIDAKFYYFTKSLLLNNQLLKNISYSHLHKNDTLKANKLIVFLTNRINNLKKCLINMPEYHVYLNNHPDLISEILSDISCHIEKNSSIENHVISVLNEFIHTCKARSRSTNLIYNELSIIKNEISNLIHKEEECIKYLKSFTEKDHLLELIDKRIEAINELNKELEILVQIKSKK